MENTEASSDLLKTRGEFEELGCVHVFLGIAHLSSVCTLGGSMEASTGGKGWLGGETIPNRLRIDSESITSQIQKTIELILIDCANLVKFPRLC